MRQWLKQAVSLKKIAKSGEHSAIKSAFLEMDGLNLFLKTKQAQPTAARSSSSLPENIRSLLCKTKEKTAHERRISNFCPFLVRMRGLEPPRACAH